MLPGNLWCSKIKSSIAFATFIWSSSGERLPSYGIGLPTCVNNLTGKPPYIGANGMRRTE